MATAKKTVALYQLQRATFEVPIIGTTPLITNKFSEKAARMIQDKQAQKTKTKKKEARDPEAEFQAAAHLLNGTKCGEKGAARLLNGKKCGEKGCRYGFPAIGFKKAAVGAARHIDGLTMAELYGAFHVLPDEGDNVEIYATEVVMRTDTVRIGQGTTDLRYRPEFRNWCALLSVDVNTASISEEQVMNCINIGGFSGGIGDWRPERKGHFGMYRVAPKKEFDQLKARCG